jgi:tetratricopeptide (TPR) repeat protein
MEEYTDQRNLRPGDPLKRALAAAKRALELAPSSGEAHARLMTIYALTGDFDQMVQAGRRAMELNPADSAAMDNLAARLNYRGQFAEALKLLLRAEQLQPVAPLWRAYAFFLAHYGQGQIPEAIERASTLAGSRNPLYLAARTIVARHRGDAAERADAFAMLAREERGFLKTPRAMYERRHYTAPLVDKLMQDILAQDLAQLPARSGPFRAP